MEKEQKKKIIYRKLGEKRKGKCTKKNVEELTRARGQKKKIG